MAMNRHGVLVVYYSRSRTTRAAAEAIARALDADIEALRDRTNRSGVFGYVRSGLEATLSRPTVLEPQLRDPRRYEVVIVGTPVWNASVSAPVRTYLDTNRGRFEKVAFSLTEGGWGDDGLHGFLERVSARPRPTRRPRRRPHRGDVATRELCARCRAFCEVKDGVVVERASVRALGVGHRRRCGT
jgi:hypothetical protein